MKNLIIIIAIVLFSITKMSAQQITKTKADLAWEALPRFEYNTGLSTFEEHKEYELFNRLYFKACVDFFKQFPNDERRINWLTHSTTVPACWQDIEQGAMAKATADLNRTEYYSTPIDWGLLEQYERERLKVRNVVLKDPAVDHQTKIRIKEAELSIIYERGKNKCYQKDKASYMTQLKNVFDFAVSEFKPGDIMNRDHFRYCEYVFRNGSNYGFTNNDYLSFLRHYKDHPKVQVREWAVKRMAIFKHLEEPFALKHVDTEGNDIDLEKLRGKVVLVDFWSTSCSDCIARMPAIRQIYDKYKDRGFIVISVAKNPTVDKERVLAIHEKIGADWPVLMIGGNAKSGYIDPNSLGKKIWESYGFSGVPQLLLLDRQGKLVMYNDLLANGDFEPIIVELLAK